MFTRLANSSGRISHLFYSTSARHAQNNVRDFRPPWVYTLSRFFLYTVIPGVVVYSVFIYDFGDRDHVFQPARHWAARQKATFLTLSPEEQRFLNADEKLMDGSRTHRNPSPSTV